MAPFGDAQSRKEWVWMCVSTGDSSVWKEQGSPKTVNRNSCFFLQWVLQRGECSFLCFKLKCRASLDPKDGCSPLLLVSARQL